MKPFFPSTRQALGQLTGLFDFVWPTAAALWNMRWQVQGFMAEVPTATVDELKKRFLFGSGIETVDLKRTVRDQTWDQQKEVFASFVLTNAFAVYEQWADEILIALGQPQRSGKKLQFPKRAPAAIAALTTPTSATTTSAFYPVSSGSGKYDLARLISLLTCYRYFKEVRNAQVHAGGVAGQEQFDAHAAFQPVSSRTALGMKGDLLFDPVVIGQPTALHLRGVVGFTDVLIRLMITMDAELSRSEKADAVLEASLRAATGAVTLSSDVTKRASQVRKICANAGLPRPVDTEVVHAFMVANRIVRA